MASASDGGRVSPEVEFGTFLRLPHQSRTFSRPADSYIPSSPPSRPTSPTPASPPPSTVFLHGRPAPTVSKMRQGAPRLGGLGLGGIVEPSPPSAPPPLPARRPQSSTSSGPTQIDSLAPAIPPASRNTISSRSASPAPARPQTPNSTKLDSNGTGNLPQRPFLSPEMDKPTVREGAFALDRPKVENVLKPSDEDKEEEAQMGEEDEQRDTLSNGLADLEQNGVEEHSTGAKGAASPEAFPSPEVGEDENGGMFDRFKSALVNEDSQEKDLPRFQGERAGEDREEESDRASIDSTGESFFGTPETAPAGADDDEEEPIADLVLGNSAVESAHEEEIAFDGPTQAEIGEVPQETHDSRDIHDPVYDESIPIAPPQDSIPPQLSLADSLISRADKSEPTEDLKQYSPAASIATSVYNSREPSIHGFDLGEKEEVEVEKGEPLPDESQPAKPFLKLPTTQPSTFTTSPTYSQTSSLPDDISSPAYSQGLRYLRNDPASEYPSPPSSPATSVQGSLVHADITQHPMSDDVSIYSVERDAKSPPTETEFIEQVSHPSSEEPQDLSTSITQQPDLSSTLYSHSSSASVEQAPNSTPLDSAAAPLSSPNPSIISSSSMSPYFDRTPTATRRSRLSYQGLGLRMPSSIAPKTTAEDEQTETSDSPNPPLARSTSTRTLPIDGATKSTEPEEPTSTFSNPPLFPWIQPTPQRPESREEHTPPTGPTESSLAVAGYQDETSYPSSPSAYAPSSLASTPEITQAYRVPISSPSMTPVVSAFPDITPQVEIPSPVPQSNTPLVRTESLAVSEPPISIPPASESPVTAPTQEATPNTTSSQERKEEEPLDPNQLSTVGVAVDIGTAVAGALVMGGLAVGQSALRGLAVGWSAWRGANNQSVIQETKVVEVSNVIEPVREEEEEKEFKSYARAKDVAEENEGSRKAESSVISTEWGEAEFDAPEGFLEEFKRAMAEIGEEDLAANEQAQIDAQLAAYQSASRQHVDAVSSPALSDNSSLASGTSSSPLAFPSSRSNRQRESSALRPQPETIEEDSADEYERELEDLLAPVWDSPSRRSRISVDFPTRHGFAPPPGLTGSAMSSVSSSRPTSVISTSSISSLPNSPSLNKSSPSSPRQPAKLSKTSKGILGFGRSKSTKNVTPKPSSRTIPPSTSLPGLSGSKSSSSLLSKETSRTTTRDTSDSRSQHSKSSSHKTAGKRSSSIFNFGGGGGGKDVPPVPNIESQIKDTTYISYSKPQRRDSNTSSISTGLYASRDPYLVAPTPGTVIPIDTTSSLGGGGRVRNRERTVSSSITSDSQRSDEGGAPLSRRRSSLRATSAYDGGSQLTRSSSIVEGEKKLYRVRFGNAVGGIGLRSVADSEAERAGGDRYGQRWVGVGRGRYGNMIIKTDEESDMVYAEQVAQIKKKWRAFGSEQSRDWAAVRIDK